MVHDDSSLEALFRDGRYAEIAAQFGFGQRLSTLRPEHRVLIGQVALFAGSTAQAADIAVRENTPTASSVIRSRCEVVLGLVKKRHADWNATVKHFQLAQHLANETDDIRQVAWSSLWLFRALAEIGDIEAATAVCNDVRRKVVRTGDAHLVAFMHDSIALMEASTGRLDEAKRHIRVTADTLARNPNAWLQQLACISSFFVDFLDCRYDSALTQLRKARDLVPQVGSGLLPVIDCNEGHILNVLGRSSAAEQRLRKVSESESAEFSMAAFDGLARLYLSTDRLADCEAALDQCEAVALRSPNAALAFSGRRLPITRLKLLLRKGLSAKALESADRHLEQARRLNDQLLIRALTFLKVEALAANGFVLEAAHLLARPGATPADADIRRHPDYQKAAAAIYRYAGSSLDKTAVERALAICEYHKDACATRELCASIGRPRLDKNGSETAESDVIKIVGSLATVFDVLHSGMLMGRELASALELVGCSAEIQASRYIDSKTKTGDNWTVELGDDRGKRITLLCKSAGLEPVKALAVADVLKIARAAATLQRALQEDRSRAALYPALQLDGQVDSLFISDEMQSLATTARKVASTTVPVLITGETGTGKEVLARTIHKYSNRTKNAFLPFNCTSAPRDMLDSQLFGHRRGAFTGATENFQGVIRAAAGGTLFLDEIGDMPLDVQPKLLRFLEASEVHPIGETLPVRVDVRVIAATNANLDALVTDGRFREDLFYRLNIVRLHVPPLRERRVEIPALAHHYLQKYAHEYAKGDLRFAEETMEYLVLYRWPGNVRQLANEMRRMAALCESGSVLMPEHLSAEIAASRRTIPASERVLDVNEVVVRLDQPMAAATEHLERAMLKYALDKTGGHIEETATLLGVSRKGLYLKRQRFGIEPPGDVAGVA